jgi:cytochrome c peroxidase
MAVLWNTHLTPQVPTLFLFAFIFSFMFLAGCGTSSQSWSPEEQRQIDSLWLGHLDSEHTDPTNQYSDQVEAQIFGQRLFFDPQLSGNGTIACATCHKLEQRFADQAAFSHAIGQTERNTPSLVGVAFSPWFYWDGRRDSLWSQALEPIENPAEQGNHRLALALLMYTEGYRDEYERVFGHLPKMQSELHHDRRPPNVVWGTLNQAQQDDVNRIFSNLGKAIAAYERLLLPGMSRFDAYVEALQKSHFSDADKLLTQSEQKGLRLFIGEAGCTQCHNGPLLTNNSFHNTGLLSSPGKIPDVGRVRGLRKLLSDEFNCLGNYSDAPDSCAELQFVQTGSALLGAMKTPSLRNVVGTAPYGHAGQFPDLASVLSHYNIAANAMIGHNEAKPLNLSPWEIAQLEAFILTLDAPLQVAFEGAVD